MEQIVSKNENGKEKTKWEKFVEWLFNLIKKIKDLIEIIIKAIVKE